MTDTLLISEAKFREYTDVNNNLDTALIKNAIREAQDIGLQAIIGTLLYEQIMNLVDSGDISTPSYSDYKTLLDSYIQDYLLYSSYWYSLDAIYLRPRNNGLVRPTGGENSEGVERELYNMKRQTVQNKMEYYAQRLTNYIIENQQTFPELNESQYLYEQWPNYNNKYHTPFAFSRTARAGYANDCGLPVYDSRYPQYPQNYFGYGKKGSLPK
jgi:hypothetical protein